MEKRTLKHSDDSASYCCEAAGVLPVSVLPEEQAFAKHSLGEGDDSASYCCEAAHTVSVDSLPNEKAFA